ATRCGAKAPAGVRERRRSRAAWLGLPGPSGASRGSASNSAMVGARAGADGWGVGSLTGRPPRVQKNPRKTSVILFDTGPAATHTTHTEEWATVLVPSITTARGSFPVQAESEGSGEAASKQAHKGTVPPAPAKRRRAGGRGCRRRRS